MASSRGVIACCMRFLRFLSIGLYQCSALTLTAPAVYIQLMPLIHEMPHGNVGIRLTRQAVTIVVMGTVSSSPSDC
jgi:hypothetical protein